MTSRELDVRVDGSTTRADGPSGGSYVAERFDGGFEVEWERLAEHEAARGPADLAFKRLVRLWQSGAISNHSGAADADV